ncbi:DUF4249 domain-containing protein [Fulvivirga lutea]|uniref:DUF4249 domain-containing protein n=1 Tax=Fulvivirga lutea TaxID=2810512 RepID=A0A975A0Z9_9BACT|nr:DUF4249 domain-containing protein [Fulvivirga lutea]QSE97899.1 DUF4249 domain-containing protein [Fulvivirga lutea]
MGKIFRLIFIILSSFWAFQSCIDPINVDVESTESNLVVDALITDQEGPYNVKLSYSTGYFDNENTKAVIGADLNIVTNDGSIIQLSESSSGNYLTPESFQGKIGSSYILNITLADGRSYKSTQETIQPNAGIDTLLFNYEVRSGLNDKNIEIEFDGINLFITTREIDENRFYRWRYESIYEIRTNPELREKKVDGGSVPDPPLCSGYIVDNSTGQVVLVGPCTCCQCWVKNFSQKVKVSDPNFISGQIKNYNIDFLKDERGIFNYKYFIEIEQLSLTKGAHEFWSQIEQQQNQGSLFDQPTGRIKSNIESLNDPDEIVLGYFGVSSIKKKSGFITPQLFPIRTSPPDSVLDDCTKVIGSSNERPPFW